MIYIVAGSLSFLMFLLFDYSQLNNRNIVKYVFGIIGLLILMSATILILIEDSVFEFHSFSKIAFLTLSLIFFALLVYSVFIEIGKNNYVKEAKPKLVTCGTYALTRHPGILWFLFMYGFLSLATSSTLLFYAAIIWSIINIVYTYFQETNILYKVFDEYSEYKKNTPMFVPNITSIRRFMTLENWRKL